MAERLLRRAAVIEKTGLSTVDIYAGMKAGTFPISVPIGRRTVGWVESEINAWIAAKIAARDNGTAKRNPAGPGRGHRRVMAEAGAAA